MNYKTKKFKKAIYGSIVSLDWFLIIVTVLSLVFTSLGINAIFSTVKDYLFPNSNYFIPYPTSISLLQLIIVTIVFSSLEELGFRGWILHKLAKKWNVRISIIVSSILFAILHTEDIIGAFLFVTNILLFIGAFFLIILKRKYG
ncbi:CPBP family intramembrane metalloprotease [Candidatus Woesearchaeota archaeon]|nr:CPBP family intramembrane metalloprotease [Candidatus Woesearchaeota archaeon]